jgi:hypothetical protein
MRPERRERRERQAGYDGWSEWMSIRQVSKASSFAGRQQGKDNMNMYIILSYYIILYT